MKEHIYFISTKYPKLIERLKGKNIALIIHSLEEMKAIPIFSHNIQMIYFQFQKPLSEIDFTIIPVFQTKIIVNEIGELNKIITNSDKLKLKDIRVYLSIQSEEHYTQLLILSSLGIKCGVYFSDYKIINWEKLNELMSSNIYSLTNNPLLEPFNHMVDFYRSNSYNDFDFGLLNNDCISLFHNEEEIPNLFLTNNKRNIGQYSILNNGECRISVPEDNIDFVYEMLEKGHNCAYCPAFKICTGNFKEEGNAFPSCQNFFSDLYDAIEYSIEKREIIK